MNEELFTMNMVVIVVKGPQTFTDRESEELANKVEDVLIKMESAILYEISKVDSRLVVRFDT